ncbi:myosin-like coiled-coil protein-domain-containing protein [Phlyctochytrium arcticum]|nr:myosin-like coiled-coil protein-domain-containing protein [Phlyctochytrium arcticum]
MESANPKLTTPTNGISHEEDDVHPSDGSEEGSSGAGSNGGRAEPPPRRESLSGSAAVESSSLPAHSPDSIHHNQQQEDHSSHSHHSCPHPHPPLPPHDALPLPQSQQDAHATSTTGTHPPPRPSAAPPPCTGKKAAQPSKKPAMQDLSSMIQSKIVQLETETSLEEEEEKAIAKAVKKASKEISQLIESGSSDCAELIQSKYIELFQETKRLEREHAKVKRKIDQSTRERDTAKSDLAKLTTRHNKLETLCRELQKENKRVKEESKRLAISEQQKREELSSKFESTIWEIKSKMEEDGDEKRRRAEDNEMLKDKFKKFLEQYTLREKHYTSCTKSLHLEIQLLEAKLDACRHALSEETNKTAGLRHQIGGFVKSERELKAQLAIYVEKFRQVEETLNKSNELFGTFRKEIEQMTRKTRKLEKENTANRLKCEKMNKNIIEMAEERTRNQKALESASAGRAKLEGLCRALQSERTTLQKTIVARDAACQCRLSLSYNSRKQPDGTAPSTTPDNSAVPPPNSTEATAAVNGAPLPTDSPNPVRMPPTEDEPGDPSVPTSADEGHEDESIEEIEETSGEQVSRTLDASDDYSDEDGRRSTRAVSSLPSSPSCPAAPPSISSSPSPACSQPHAPQPFPQTAS